jgi:hypothetical protein
MTSNAVVTPAHEPRSPELQRLVRFVEGITLQDTARMAEVYTEDAWFKDPFNEVRGIGPITQIFAHMFSQVDAPRFVVHETLAQGPSAMLTWDFEFGFRRPLRSGPQRIRGCSHVRFASDGRVCFHRDYWDVAEELYEKLPGIGGLMRWMRRRAALPATGRLDC